jgi:hypothetical protein
MAHKKWTTRQEKFQKTAVELAKEALEHAIEWIDHKETGWATVEAERALVLLNAAKKA